MAFNMQSTLFEAIVNGVLALGPCGEVDLVMSPNFEIDGLTGGGAYWTGRCLKPLTLDVDAHMTITFKPPVTRENGTPLTLPNIDHFEVEVRGNCARVRVIAEGLESKFTEQICKGDKL